jgi:hypothetical protein
MFQVIVFISNAHVYVMYVHRYYLKHCLLYSRAQKNISEVNYRSLCIPKNMCIYVYGYLINTYQYKFLCSGPS